MPKDAYRALDQLINHEWRTQMQLQTDAQGLAGFRGFLGTYTVAIERNGKTIQQAFQLKKASPGQWTIVI